MRSPRFMAILHPSRMETTFFFSLYNSINLPMRYPTMEIPTNGSNAENCPATMKTMLATEMRKSLREGLATKYRARKDGKKRKRNVSDVKSIDLPNRIESYGTRSRGGFLRIDRV